MRSVMRRLRISTQPISMIRSPKPALRPVVSVSSTMLRIGALPQRFYPPVGERVGALVLRVSGVSFHPMPRDTVSSGDPVKLPPQIHVFHRLLVGGAPAPAFPVVQPLADAFLNVLRVGVHLNFARRLQRLERPDYGGELHTVVGGIGFATEKFPIVPARFDQRTPSARARVALAGTVRINTDDFSAALAFRHAVRFPAASPEPVPSWGRACRASSGSPGASRRRVSPRERRRRRRRSATSGRQPSP